MKATIDRLSSQLCKKYVHYLEAFSADYSVLPGAIEFRCHFTLLSDHAKRQMKCKAPALDSDTEAQRDFLAAMIFEALEHIIVDTITRQGKALN